MFTCQLVQGHKLYMERSLNKDKFYHKGKQG